MRLHVEEVGYTYDASKRGCPPTTFVAKSGEILALIGASGSGKSTCLACIAGILVADSGQVDLRGANENAGPGKVLVMQTAPLFEALRSWENVALGWGVPHPRRRGDALAMLTTFDLADCADSLPRELSSGQRQRVAVVCALSTNAPVLLFDEPTGNLDDANAELVMSHLRQAASGGRVVVVATHDSRVLRGVDSIVKMGRV